MAAGLRGTKVSPSRPRTAVNKKEENSVIKLNIAKTVRILLTTLTVAASMGGLGAQPADALTSAIYGTCRGTIEMPPTIQGTIRTTSIMLPINPMRLDWGYMNVPVTAKGLNVGQVVVQRAAASCATTEAQIVYVTYRVIGFTNIPAPPWQVLTSPTSSVRLEPGYQGSFAAREIFPTNVTPNLHLDVNVQWWTASGKYLGQTWLNYGASGDYRCATGFTCSVRIDATYGAYIAQ
jgi:hypothetical protein